jgi:hypothetical protein
MTTLERLDNIKSNLQDTLQALQEADKWTSLAKQIEQVVPVFVSVDKVYSRFDL